jgi:hypothetical protein
MFTKKKLILTVLLFFFVVLALMKIIKSYNNSTESKIEFSAVILAINKYRRVYKIELSSKNKNIVVLDYSYKDHVGLIHIGDSLIKKKGTRCYEFKREGRVIIQKCEGVFFYDSTTIRILPNK